MREHVTLRRACALPPRRWQLYQVRLGYQGLERATMSLAQPLGLLLGNLETLHDVRGNVTAGAEKRPGMPDLPAVEDRHIGRSSTQLDQRAAQLDLVGREHGQ